MTQQVWTIEQAAVRVAESDGACAVMTDRARRLLEDQFDSLEHCSPAELEGRSPDAVVVAGGGSLIDPIKVWRLHQSPNTFLIAVPTIWGSGAEQSPVAVVNEPGSKRIELDDRLLPDARVLVPELGTSVPPALARAACGDAWGHAVEGLLSPLARPETRSALAAVIGRMVGMPIGFDPDWFGLSGSAAALQAQSSVGLAHGIAHTLEPALASEPAASGPGHARLVAAYLWPVFEFVCGKGDGAAQLFADYGVDFEQVASRLRETFDAETFAATLPYLRDHWPTVLRDPMTRTNSVLVRRGDIEYFEEFTA